MSLGSILMEMQIHEDRLGSKPKFRIRLPDVPRIGETLTLPDAHYLVTDVFWQAHIPLTEAPKGFVYPDDVYYTIRILVAKKVIDEADEDNGGTDAD